MQRVQSSNLYAVDYDISTQVLTVQFRNNRVYEYSGVPTEIFRGLLSASSKGGYASRFIFKKFKYKRIK